MASVFKHLGLINSQIFYEWIDQNPMGETADPYAGRQVAPGILTFINSELPADQAAIWLVQNADKDKKKTALQAVMTFDKSKVKTVDDVINIFEQYLISQGLR